MAKTRSATIKHFYDHLIGQAVTVHLVGGETMNGTVLDVDAGDLLLQRTGYQDLVMIPRHGFAALTAGQGNTSAGAPSSTTAEGGAEALPEK